MVSSTPPRKKGVSRGAIKDNFSLDSLDKEPNFRSSKQESKDKIKQYKKSLLKATLQSDIDFLHTVITYHKKILI